MNLPDGVKIYYVRAKTDKAPLLTVAIARHHGVGGEGENMFKIDRATAYCSPADYPPVKRIGRAIAINRLLSYRKYPPDRQFMKDKYPNKNGIPIWLMPKNTLELTRHNGTLLTPTKFEIKLLKKRPLSDERDKPIQTYSVP